MPAKKGLYANIHAKRKRIAAGSGRPKSKSTISKAAYANMKLAFLKQKKKVNTNH